jgi:hypothetical protein
MDEIPKKKVRCYKCGGHKNLLVEEKKCSETGALIDKNFICSGCANLFEEWSN